MSQPRVCHNLPLRRLAPQRAPQGDVHGGAQGEAEAAAVDDDHGGGREGSTLMYLSISIAFIVASTGIALVVTDLKRVLSVVGSTGSTTVSYILPGGMPRHVTYVTYVSYVTHVSA